MKETTQKPAGRGTESADAQPQAVTYRDAGVDIDAGNALVRAIKPLIKATMRSGADGEVGGFGGVFDLKATGFRDPLLVACNDGVGTKLRLAIETGQHKTIGIDLVAMCVNDLVVQGAEPLFFLDYFATGALDLDTARDVIEGIATGCRQSGCALIGGETAEMPGMYQSGDYDLAGFSVGAVERDELLPSAQLAAGDVIIALPSSGVHSNGYSLVRRLVEKAGLGWEDKAPWEASRTVAASLLEPTRIYVKPILAALKQCGASGSAIRALAHITGGGLSENIPRVLKSGLKAQIDLESFTPPPVFGWLAKTGNLPASEMLRTFNCGIGMVVITAPDKVDAVTSALTQVGEAPIRIGEIIADSKSQDNGGPNGEGVVYSGSLRLAP